MSEFKFACPVCGQHITADSSATGSQLGCPTCFRKIIVPQAPSSTETKFVLSASEAAKPRPVTAAAAATAAPVQPVSTGRSLPLILAALGVFLLAVGASLYLFREKLFSKNPNPAAFLQTNATAKVEMSRPRMPAGTNVWSLDLADAQFPAETAFGKIHGLDFICDRAIAQGGTLNLRTGREWPPEVGVSIVLFAKQAEELSEKSALVTTNNLRSPRVVLRWKEGAENKTEIYTNGFALKLEFGAQKGNRLPGKIYLSLPDPTQSCIAGVFNAEIRKPSPPKPKPGQ